MQLFTEIEQVAQLILQGSHVFVTGFATIVPDEHVEAQEVPLRNQPGKQDRQESYEVQARQGYLQAAQMKEEFA